MNKLNIITILAAIFTSCNPPVKPVTEGEKTENHSEIHQLDWLLGSWVNSSVEGINTEEWTKLNDSVFNGKSCFVLGNGDTASKESLRLEVIGKEVFYIPTVQNQNAGKAVRFRMSMADGKQWVFENPQHDFPTKIMYTRIGTDSLLAEISGMMDGKASSMQFPMKKRK